MSTVFAASPPAWQGLWVIVTVVVLALLAGLLFLALQSRRPRASGPRAEIEPEPLPPPPGPDAASDLAIATYAHIIDAERAYASAREDGPDAPWLHDVAFVERHGHGRIGIRGTFAGHYVDFDDLRLAESRLYAEVSDDLAGAESALIVFGPEETADAMARAMDDGAARVVRRHLSKVDAEALRASVADTPLARAPS